MYKSANQFPGFKTTEDYTRFTDRLSSRMVTTMVTGFNATCRCRGDHCPGEFVEREIPSCVVCSVNNVQNLKITYRAEMELL